MKALFETAFGKFLKQDQAILDGGTSERNWCARLGYHLQIASDEAGHVGYFADAEYNRNNGSKRKVKTVMTNGEPIDITCDLILHSRGKKGLEDNFIAVEMKKCDRPSKEKESDKTRLRALTTPTDEVHLTEDRGLPEHVCGYKLGVYAEFIVRENRFTLEYYERGNRFEVTSMALPNL